MSNDKISNDNMIDIYGTIGPACAQADILEEMFRLGMTGIRLNLSHVSLEEAAGQIGMIHAAARRCGIIPKLLIDMQGPEIRTGKLLEPIFLEEGSTVVLAVAEESVLSESTTSIPVPPVVLPYLIPGQEILLDDGKLLLEIQDSGSALVKRGGWLQSSKSLALPGIKIPVPAMTAQDRINIREAGKYGVTGVMQPFVRSAEDLREVRDALDDAGWKDIRLFAKIENMDGVENLESFFGIADEIVIARGDLGNAMPLWQLPRIQKELSGRCRKAQIPFMVVTQMLASMEHRAVPTRAEVSDIYNAVCDGASSVMVTGETAIGDYPAEVIRYLANTVKEARK